MALKFRVALGLIAVLGSMGCNHAESPEASATGAGTPKPAASAPSAFAPDASKENRDAGDMPGGGPSGLK